MARQCAELCAGAPAEERRGSPFPATRFFTTATPALLLPCALSSAALLI